MPFAPLRTPRRRAYAWATLAVVFALAIGYLGGLLTPKLTTPGDTSPEAGFARDMSTHHAQAVDMAMIAYQKASDPDIRQLGLDIALTQQDQIGIMQTWLKDWNLQPTGTQPKMAWMPGMATTDELNQLNQATGKQVDILFCQLMLRHHLGGIHMVEAVLTLTHNQRVLDLANNMKAGQQKEVTQLKDDLTRLGAQPLGS
jgi:uncharacterized protein (DUF305 family)